MKACKQLFDYGNATAYSEANPVSLPLCRAKLQSDLPYESLKSSALLEVERLNSIFNNLPVAVITLDKHGYVSFCNDMAVQYFDFQVVGTLWRTLIEHCFLQNTDNDELVLKDGRVVRLDTSPLDDKCGQVLIFSDVTRDIDIKKIRDHYTKLSELGEMAASLAHQIRTPLAASMLFFSNIKKSLDISSASHSSLEKGMSGLRHIESMIKDMLMFSQSDKKNNEEFEISELINEIKQDADALMYDYNCDIEIHDQAVDLSIKGNRHSLRAAISNLIVNAAQACRTRADACHSGKKGSEVYKGIISLNISGSKCSNINSTANILIEDNGIGIDSSELERIKEPFYTTRSCGTGLGLSVVKSVVDNHGGSLNIESVVMKGTSITILLP